MEVLIEHLGEVQFGVKARQHFIACDQPVENGGYDEGMTPPELFLASLGSCAAYYAAQYLRKKKLATAGTFVRVSAGKATDPPRLEDFKIELILPVDVSEEDRAGVLDSVRHCLIHNTLLHPPRMSVELKTSAVLSG